MMNFFNPLFTLGALSSISALMTICLQRKHLLNTLLALEILMVSIFLLLVSLSNLMSNEGLMIFVLLTLAASEASIGLAMLVILIRAHGNDYVSSISIHKC
uniref:NADH-ubiquinone oxidoreductase chain 4L n=1 Tax=Katharina tunicata TaxID=34587 RepID=Q34845_KATTU|nr:NADH dehydrogenase subunit 4L [Katharina tunicata]AAC48368.1 NADH dehydogenase subunit 4L [Katharina tunicata]